MSRFVKGENLADEVLKETLKENVIDLTKKKAYYVTTDEEGNIFACKSPRNR